MNKKLPLVAIIGRPNVGKSTLFNRLIGKRIAIMTDIPGTTRDRLYEVVTWEGKEFVLIDTAGIELAFDERFKEDVQNQIETAVSEADLIVFMTDLTSGITIQDQHAIKTLRKSKKPALLVVNKADNTMREQETADFYKLGLGEPFAISAISGRNTGDLLDEIVDKLNLNPPRPRFDSNRGETNRAGKTSLDSARDKNEKAVSLELEELQELPELEILPENKTVNVAIIGRPNVGKSSLFNALVDQNRAIVSDVPGTTRDIVSTVFDYNDNKIQFIDTAGLRKRGRIGKKVPGSTKQEGRIERYSALRSIKSIDEADICLILIDATEKVVAQDLHLAGFIKDAHKGIIIVVNKIDEAEDINPETYLSTLRYKFDFMSFAPAIFISAKTGKNVKKIFDIILAIRKARETKIPTPKLNKFLEQIILTKPPAGLKNKKPKMKYMTQVGTNPPYFVIFTSYSELIHFSYKRYIENKMRKEFDFNGTSIKIEFRNK